ncbi:uncharacterized protein LOC110434815 [Sorghum bicolor]|uniref:uncharacterized protein LOC110434815 n=1 Tax=Sorghum bicolor TaxID=4558 RepID=UPI000B4262CA|nr:uncharacterized protein LOC110434815 [Sorghum bicolor]|eukprot:XP_021315224.1 uncharacterized protein LOC110434815 [Sorghum bicolor]
MNSWPEYDEQVALLRSRLVDTYWDAAPAWYREDVVGYYRAARRWRMRDWWVVRFVVAPTSAVMIADASFPLGIDVDPLYSRLGIMPRKRSRARRVLEESSSDDDELLILSTAQLVQAAFSNEKGKHGGSVKGHRVLHRDRQGGHDRMFQDYLADNPTYTDEMFRRRYRMSRDLFKRIMKAVEEHDDYFVQKRNAANVLGLSSFQKITAAMRMLAYGVPADATDEYVRIGESTALESLRRFVRAVIEVFGDEYLRSPNEKDIARLLALGEKKGFPAEGIAPEVKFTVNGHDYTMGYYLADGIYPSWATLIKSITLPMGNKKQYFAKAQEAARKMVERALGVLQSRWAIIRGPGRPWDSETLALIMRACIIMHNMIIEDEGYVVDPQERFDYGGDNVEPEHGRAHRTLEEYIEAHRKIRDKDTHVQLKEDLIEHLWNNHFSLSKFILFQAQ